MVAPHGRAFSVMAFTVTNGKIVQIDALLDPERLEQLELSIRRESCTDELAQTCVILP